MTDVQQILQQRLQNALSPTSLDITNESHLHAGHEGARGGAQHFAVRIVCAQFAGMSRVKQHQLVYAAVADLIPYPIHALRIDAKSLI